MNKFSIYIKRRTQTGWLLFLIIMMPCFFGFLVDVFRFPNAIKYTLDAVWLCLLVYLIRFYRLLQWRKVKQLLVWSLAFLGYTLLVYLFRFQSPLYYLWGARNNFRFYVTFFAMALFMDTADAEDYLKKFDVLFWLNLGITLIQYFLLGYRGDYLGGLFGVEKGGNAYSNIFLIIVVSRSILYCFQKQETLSACLAKCVVALAIAAMAELKFFFIEFAVIVGLIFCMTNFSWRKLLILIAAVAGVLAGIAVLIKIYPEFHEAFLLKNLIASATSDLGYTMRGDFNRLTAISSVNERFFDGILDRLFGLGLGNCDTSSFSFLLTPFARRYAWTNYHWFSTSFMYVENGVVGMFFFIGFFVLQFFQVQKLKRSGNANILHCKLAQVMAVCCVMLLVYNSSLRTEAAYMVYFVLAIPFMQRSDRRTIIGRNAHE